MATVWLRATWIAKETQTVPIPNQDDIKAYGWCRGKTSSQVCPMERTGFERDSAGSICEYCDEQLSYTVREKLSTAVCHCGLPCGLTTILN